MSAYPVSIRDIELKVSQKQKRAANRKAKFEQNLVLFPTVLDNVKEEYKNTTKKNLDIIYNLVPDTNNSFKFAVIADNHYHYNSLRTIVNDITKNPNISFVISAGDVTDMGLLKEYEIFYEIMNNLDKPYLTVIGNHDYNSNGGIIYGSAWQCN